jgi:hypothetical protein
VTTFGPNGGGLTIASDGWLLLCQTACRFDCRTQNDGHSGADSAQHAAVAIGCRLDFKAGARSVSDEDIVVLTTPHFGASEADSVFYPKHGRKTEKCFGQISFEFIEDWFTPNPPEYWSRRFPKHRRWNRCRGALRQ